jgi:hypothetical protein
MDDTRKNRRQFNGATILLLIGVILLVMSLLVIYNRAKTSEVYAIPSLIREN